jgi:hypothetical protein
MYFASFVFVHATIVDAHFFIATFYVTHQPAGWQVTAGQF